MITSRHRCACRLADCLTLLQVQCERHHVVLSCSGSNAACHALTEQAERGMQSEWRAA